MHLYKNYAHISDTDMTENEKILRAPYNAEDPLKSLIKTLKECTDFATGASEPVSDTQLVHIAYVLLAETEQ